MANGSGLGTGSKLFLTVDIDMLGEEKLGQLQKMLQSTGIQAENANQNLNTMADSTDNVGSSAKDTNEQFGKMFGLGMNIMFLGMALNMIFGRMAKNMLSMTGASAAFGAAMKSVLLPFFLAITPLVIQLSMAMMDLPRSIKMVVGALVGLLALIGPIVFFGAQLFLLTTQLSISFGGLLLVIGSLVLAFGALGMSMFFLMRAFKGISPIVNGVVAAALGSLLTFISPTLGAAVMLAALFTSLVGIFKKFGNVVGTIASVAVAALGIILVAFGATTAGIAIAVTAILALSWNFRDEIVNALQGLWQFIKKWTVKLMDALLWPFRYIYKKIVGNSIIPDLVKDVKSWLGEMLDFITSLPSKIVSMAKNFADATVEIGKSIVNGVVDGISSIGDSITDTFFGFLPGPLATAVKGVSKFSGGLVNRIQDVLTPDDFILTSGGKMIQPASNDTIVGFNGNGPIQPGAGGGGVTVNINDPVMKEDVDVVERVVDEVEDRVNRDTRGRTGGLGT